MDDCHCLCFMALRPLRQNGRAMYAYRFFSSNRDIRFLTFYVNYESCSPLLLHVGYLPLPLSLSWTHAYRRFLMAQMFAGFICYLAWASSTVSNPPVKRAAALALINTISQTGNIVGSYIWVTGWGPTYNKSYAICIAAAVGCVLVSLGLRSKLKRLNSKMDEDHRENRKWRYHT